MGANATNFIQIDQLLLPLDKLVDCGKMIVCSQPIKHEKP